MSAIDFMAMSDADFISRAEMQVWLSAFASNNPRAPAHRNVDAAYDEAQRRGKPWLYQEAWNRAYASCGYEVSDVERRRAIPPAGGVMAPETVGPDPDNSQSQEADPERGRSTKSPPQGNKP